MTSFFSAASSVRYGDIDPAVQAIGRRCHLEGFARVGIVLGSFGQAHAWLKDAAKARRLHHAVGDCTSLHFAALGWIPKQLGHGAGLAVLGGATTIDTLVQLFYTGALQSLRLAAIIRHLISAIMRFMGRTVATSPDITVAFVDDLLGMLFRLVSVLARQALDALVR